MGKVNFFLKEPKSKKETLIFLVLNINYKRLKYSTGEFILPERWDAEDQSPIISRKYPNNSNIQRRLEEYRFFLTDLLGEYKRQRVDVTPDLIREQLDINFKVKKESSNPAIEKIDLMSYIDMYVKQCEDGTRLTPKNKTKYKKWTIKGYKTLKNHLLEYVNDNKVELNFNDITMGFYNNFLNYFHYDNKATNTIGKNIKNLKVIMSSSFDEGLHNNTEFQKKEFKVIEEASDNIYLTESELDAIYELDLSGKKDLHLDKVRDLFIISARTALRYSDVTNLKRHNFMFNEKGYFLSVIAQKPGKLVMIPLKKQVVDIFNKYNGELPRALSNQKMNSYLKEIGKKAGINTIMTKSITKGGVKEQSIKEKWELITTHTARRSAATNLFLAGFPAISIMRLTGHGTERSFMKYIRMSEEDNAYKMAESDYFRNDFKEENYSTLKVVG